MAKFRIADEKERIGEMYEKSGGRHQTFVVENKDISRAKGVGELKIK